MQILYGFGNVPVFFVFVKVARFQLKRISNQGCQRIQAGRYFIVYLSIHTANLTAGNTDTYFLSALGRTGKTSKEALPRKHF